MMSVNILLIITTLLLLEGVAMLPREATKAQLRYPNCAVATPTDPAPKYNQTGLIYFCFIGNANEANMKDLLSPRAEALKLQFNQAEGQEIIIPNNTFSGMPNLEWIWILGNSHPHISSGTFGGLDKLSNLTIGLTKPNTLQSYSNWSVVERMRSTWAPSYETGWLLPLMSLKELNLCFSNRVSFPIGEFCGHPYLISLHLCDNRLNDSKRFGIECAQPEIGNLSCHPCLPRLTVLDLSQNVFSTLDVDFRHDMPQLKFLNISHSTVLEILPNTGSILFESIEVLDISNNRLPALTKKPLQTCNAPELHVLLLQNNQIHTIWPGFFICMPNLKHLDLSGNHISKDALLISSLANLTRLELLNLDDNNIMHLHADMMANLSNLRTFSCRKCSLTTISNDTFVNLVNISYLFLSSNRLHSVQSNCFTYMQNLHTLGLSGNSLVHFEVLETLPMLKELYLYSNLLENIPDFSGTWPQLSVLELSRNAINNFGPHQLSGLKSLTELSLAFNNISYIPAHAFRRLNRLIKLNLQNNIIQKIHDKGLYGLRNLVDLRLDHNLISTTKYYFQLIRLKLSLRYLNMSGNMIKTLYLSLRFDKLQSADFSWNHITYIIQDTFNNPDLLFVNLTHNWLHNISPEDIITQTHPRPQLFLGWNPLNCDCKMKWLLDTRFDMSVFEVLRHKKTYLRTDFIESIKGNMQEGVVYFYLQVSDLNKIYCEMPTVGVNNSQTPLITFEHQCSYITECDPFICECCQSDSDCECRSICYKQCECVHRNHHSTNSMKCTSRNITMLPSYGPYYAKEIFLDNNSLTQLKPSKFHFPQLERLFLNNSHISRIASGTFSQLKMLKEIHLENNYLQKIVRKLFGNLTTLQEIYLHENRIGTIEDGSFDALWWIRVLWLHNNNLKELNLTIFDNMKYLNKLTLHGNPWNCDCNFGQEFQKWLSRNHGRISDVEDIHCLSNMSAPCWDEQKDLVNSTEKHSSTMTRCLLSRPIIVMDFSFCRTHIIVKHRESVMGIICTASTLIAIGLVAIVIYAKRMLLMVWAYNSYGVRCRRNHEDEDNTDKPYDIFIAYDERDQIFALLGALKVLEEGDISYKVCVEFRDWPLCSHFTESTIASVEQSKRTILIISKHYKDSEWCQYAFQKALAQGLRDRQRRLFVILTDETLMDNLDQDIRQFLQTGTYLVKGEARFWDKLRYYMADNPRGSDKRMGRRYMPLNVKRGRYTTSAPDLETGEGQPPGNDGPDTASGDWQLDVPVYEIPPADEGTDSADDEEHWSVEDDLPGDFQLHVVPTDNHPFDERGLEDAHAHTVGYEGFEAADIDMPNDERPEASN